MSHVTCSLHFLALVIVSPKVQRNYLGAEKSKSKRYQGQKIDRNGRQNNKCPQ